MITKTKLPMFVMTNLEAAECGAIATVHFDNIAIKAMASEIDEALFDALATERGYAKSSTCTVIGFTDWDGGHDSANKVVCDGYHVLSCGHRCPGDWHEAPNYCPTCRARVLSSEGSRGGEAS